MREFDISFASNGLQLAGTLALADGDGPFPAALFIPGSGKVDRNENHKKMQLNSFNYFAHHLAARGFASFRYDKRGVGGSDGVFLRTGFYDNVTDAAFRLLQNQEQIDADRAFIIGHSEGAIIASRLAGEGVAGAGIALLAGTSRPGKEVLAKVALSTTDTLRVQLVVKLNAKWMREFIAYDPGADLVKVRCPVLAITGENDVQVDPADVAHMKEIAAGPFEGHVVSGLTHLLRSGEPGTTDYKRQLTFPLDERVPALVLEWLERHSAAARPRGDGTGMSHDSEAKRPAY